MAAKKVNFWADIDLHGGSIRNVKVDSLSEAPSDGLEAGRMYYNSTEGEYYYCNGTEWVRIVRGDDLDLYQLLSEKDQASGYAGLDSSGRVVIGEIPTGAEDGTVPLLVASISDGYVLRYDAASGGFVGQSVTGIYTYRGSVASYDALPSDATAGDVYNVIAAYGTHPAGTNWAWTGTEWDALGGTVDLTVKADAVEMTAGTYTKVTVNSQGVVSAGAELEADDVPDLDASKIASGVLDTARLTSDTAEDGEVLVCSSGALAYGYRTSYLSIAIAGDGSTTAFSATHDLGVLPAVTLYNTDGAVVYTDIACTTSTVTVSFNTAPSDGTAYTLVLVG